MFKICTSGVWTFFYCFLSSFLFFSPHTMEVLESKRPPRPRRLTPMPAAPTSFSNSASSSSDSEDDMGPPSIAHPLDVLVTPPFSPRKKSRLSLSNHRQKSAIISSSTSSSVIPNNKGQPTRMKVERGSIETPLFLNTTATASKSAPASSRSNSKRIVCPRCQENTHTVILGIWQEYSQAVYYCGNEQPLTLRGRVTLQDDMILCGHVWMPNALLQNINRVVMFYDSKGQKLISHFQ